jgi:hypothetical protein
MSLLCLSIPLLHALSYLLTDLELSFYNRFMKCTAIDPFLSFLGAGTANLVSRFIQRTTNTLLQFGTPQAIPTAQRPQTSAQDALECPYSDCVSMFVRQGNFKRYLGISHQGQPPPQASHRQSHLPL